ncbi:MAG: membrane protein insertase YidC [Bacteroidota bacterium]
MHIDRNQVIGLFLIFSILTIYSHIFLPGRSTQSTVTPAQQEQPSKKATKIASPGLTPQYGVLSPTTQGIERELILENEVMKVTLSSLGGTVKQVILKQYKDHQGDPLVLLDTHSSHMGFQWGHSTTSLNTRTLFFEVADQKQRASDTDTAQITFMVSVGDGRYIKQTYALPSKGYTLTNTWQMVGVGGAFGDAPLQFVWRNHIKRVEKDIEACRSRTTVNYYLADHTFSALSERVDKAQEQLLHYPVQWVGIKQRFFTAAVITDTPFAGGYLATKPPQESSSTVKEAQVRLTLPNTDASEDRKGQFTFYFGPNEHRALSTVAPGFTKNIPLGWPVIRWINQFMILPLFSFLELYISNYGIIIIVLVFVIKVLLFPLSYKSYMAMAKMRVLQPEFEKIKAKCSGDVQRIQMEQVKFYQDMGVNPMSGCVPVLLQMPILLAMFNFFPNAIALRQQAFLWASDLSTYDVILQLPFRIPAYGSHVSLFTLLMTASTILYARSNNQMSTATTPQEEALKMVTYLMPFTFMFILNSLPAGLSFYYFISNLVTFGQQCLIKYFFNENVLREQLQQRKGKRKDPKKPRAQVRLEAAKQRRKK